MESLEPCVFGRQLGEGIDSVVRMCTIPSSDAQLACKSVSKSNAGAVRHIQNEISMLEKLKDGNINIISSFGHFEDAESIHLFLELCDGGDLCDYIQRNGLLSESEASIAMSSIAGAVSFCHRLGIAHRDLKAENILFPHPHSSFSDLKLADFGTAADFFTYGCFNEAEGTPWYLAPEIFTGSYDEKVDVWSLGVLLHIMLSGHPPFDGETTSDVFHAIKRGRVDLKQHPLPCVSEEAKSLLKGMLQKNPYRRLKLKDVLLHPWLQKPIIAISDPDIPLNLEASVGPLVVQVYGLLL